MDYSQKQKTFETVRRADLFLCMVTAIVLLELAISCVTPLSFGNFSEYTVIFILFILLFIYCMCRLFRTLACPENRFHGNAGLLALLFVSLYLSVLPGIAEGIYRTAALSVYHTGILFFVVWCNYLLKWYYQKQRPWYFAIICLCLAGILGCNEIISFILLLIVGFKMRNNVSLTVKDLYSGHASQYDKALNQRYELIKQCKGDTCIVPYLKVIPFAFRFCPNYEDPHFSDYFNKQIILRNYDQ